MMQVTEDDDPESRGRLAPHELPYGMGCVFVACRRLSRLRAEQAVDAATGVASPGLAVKVARAVRIRRLSLMMLAAHFTSYDMVMMAPVRHAEPELSEPWNQLSGAEFLRVTRFGVERFNEAADALTVFPAVMRACDGIRMTRRRAFFTMLRRM